MKVGSSSAAVSLLMHQNNMMQSINRTSARVALSTIEQREKTVDALIYKVIHQQQTNDKIVEIGVEIMTGNRIIDVFA